MSFYEDEDLYGPRTDLGDAGLAQQILEIPEERKERYDQAEQGVARICRVIGLTGYNDYINATSFDHLEAVFRFAEGSTYRVDKTVLRGSPERVVAVKRVINSTESNTLVLHELVFLRLPELRNHPNIATPEGYGWGTSFGSPHFYLVEEFASFGTLASLLRSTANITIEQKLQLCQDVAEGINVLHGCSIAHGDIKMENTLVFAHDAGQDKSFNVRISDFGHAIVRDGVQYLGTPHLVAPEVRGRPESRPVAMSQYQKCDIYSYGILVWEVLLNGRRYYRSADGATEPRVGIDLAPEADLLRSSLSTLHRAATEAGLSHRNKSVALWEDVLFGSLQYQPENRSTAGKLVEIFRQVTGDKSRARYDAKALSQRAQLLNLIGVEEDDDIPEFRGLRLILEWPVQISEMIVRHLQKVSVSAGKRRAASALYCLSICHTHGMCADSNTDKMLATLKQAALMGDVRASLLYPRICYSHGMTPDLSHMMGTVAYTSAMRLTHSEPHEDYYGIRLKEHEALFHRELFSQPFDLFCEETHVAGGLSFASSEVLRGFVARFSTAAEIDGLRIVSQVSEPGQTQGFSIPLLHCAARLGSVDLIQLLVAHGANPNHIHENHGIALLHACKGSNSNAVDALIGCGAYCVPGQFESPLSFLFMLPSQDQSQALQALLNAGFPVNGSSNGSKTHQRSLDVFPHLAFSTPIFRAIATNDRHLCELLLQAGATYCTIGENTALYLAASHHMPELTQLFLRCKSKSTEKDFPIHDLLLLSSTTLRLLHGCTATKAFESTLEILLNASHDVNALDTKGHSPLISILQDFSTIDPLNYGVLKVLVERGAKFEIHGGLSAHKVIQIISSVAWNQRGEVLKFLMSKGIVESVIDGDHLIRVAIEQNQTGMVTYLMQHRDTDTCFQTFDINNEYVATAEEEGEEEAHMTLLLWAIASMADATTVRYLLEHGADPNKKTTVGKDRYLTCLEVALGNPGVNAEVIDLLLDYGVDMFLPRGTDLFTFSASCKTKLEMHGGHPLSHILRDVHGVDGSEPRHRRARELFDDMVENGFGSSSRVPEGQHDLDAKFLPLYTALGTHNIGALEALFDHKIKVPKDDPLCGSHLGALLVPREVADKAQLYATRKSLARMMGLLLQRVGWGSVWPPLHTAAIVGYKERVIELLDSGEDLMGLNSENQTARQAAEKCLQHLQSLDQTSKETLQMSDASGASEDVMSVLKVLRDRELGHYFKDIARSVRETQSIWDYPEKLNAKAEEVNALIDEHGPLHVPTAQRIIELADSYTHLEQWEDATVWYSLIASARDLANDKDPFVFRAVVGLLDCASELGQPMVDLELFEYCKHAAPHFHQAAIYEVFLVIASLHRVSGDSDTAMTMLNDLENSLLADQLEASRLDISKSTTDHGNHHDVSINENKLDKSEFEYWQDLSSLRQALIHGQKLQWGVSRSIWTRVLSRETTPPEKFIDLTKISALAYASLIDRRSKADARTAAIVRVLNDIAKQCEGHDRWDESLSIRRYCYGELTRIYGGSNFLTQKSLQALTIAARKMDLYDETALMQETFVSLLQQRYHGSPRQADILANQIILAEDFARVGRFKEAKLLFEELLHSERESAGPRHETTLKIMERYMNAMFHPDLAEEAGSIALSLYEAWSESWETDDSAAERAMYYVGRAIGIHVMQDEIRYDLDTMQMWFDVTEQLHGADDTRTLYFMVLFALTSVAEGSFDEAEQICRAVLEKHLKLFGPNRTETVIAASCLRLILHRQDRHDEAKDIAIGDYQLNYSDDEVADLQVIWLLHYVAQRFIDQELYESAKQMLGPIADQLKGNKLTRLGIALLSLRVLYGMMLFESQGTEKDAEMIFRDVLDSNSTLLTDTHRVMRLSTFGLAQCLRFSKKPLEAQVLMNRLLDTVDMERLQEMAMTGREYLDFLEVADSAVAYYKKRFSPHRLVQSQRIAYEIRKILEGEDSEDCIQDLANLIAWERKAYSWEKVVLHQHQLVGIRERLVGENNRLTKDALEALVQASFEAKDWASAESALNKLITRFVSNDDIYESLNYKSQLAEVYWHTARWAKAQAVLEPVLEQARAKCDRGDAQVTAAKVMLAKVCLCQNRVHDCEELIREILSVPGKVPFNLSDVDPPVDSFDPNREHVMQCRILQCRLYLQQKHFWDAQFLAETILRWLEEEHRDRGSEAIEILKLQMRAYRGQGDWDTAIKLDEEIETREASEKSLQAFLRGKVTSQY